jgi:RNA polymerase sigma-70 factor (ECF subfamily)
MARREGDFEGIMLPHALGLLRFAVRLTGNSSQAEDLVQETLLRAWRGFEQFEAGSNAHAWLFRILVNGFRQQKRKERSSLATAPLPDAVQAAPPASHEFLDVRQAFDLLPDDQRIVLFLAVVEGFTCREVSEILDVPIGTVMSRLSRARAVMRERLSEVVR